MDPRKSIFGGWTPAQNLNGRPSMFAQSGRRNQQDFPKQSTTGRISLTSDARYSFAGGAPSFGARPSAFPGMAGRQSLAVPRILNVTEQKNIRDKQVQYVMIEKVVTFLADCYNPHPPFKFDDHTFLRNPNRNDFKNVFEFLMQYIQPSYQMVKLDEDKLVKIVNNLGYPYPFKPNTLKTMTTATTWPTMLSVLDWLVDIIEMETNIRSRNKIGDVAKWQLLVSCYKRNVDANRGNKNTNVPTKTDLALFDEEFEAYKQTKLGENEGSEAFDLMRARRIACEKKLAEVEKDIAEVNEDIATSETMIADLESDIASLQKYNEDVVIKTSQIEQMLIQATEIHGTLGRTIEKLNAENANKERQITAQKISGSEARQLFTERQSIRDELAHLRIRMGKEEGKLFESQPDYFNVLGKLRSEYTALICGLKGLCESICNSMEAKNITSSLDKENFEQICEDIQKSGIDESKLARLIAHLKELFDRKLLAYKHNEEAANQQIEDLQKNIRELQSTKEQRRTQYELEIEKAMRVRDDKLCPENDHKHKLDLVRQKHKTTAEALAKYTGQLNDLHEKLAEKHKEYIAYKQQLDSKYSELQSAFLEKTHKLCERFEQIQAQKARYKELFEQMLKDNNEMIQQFKEKQQS